MEEVRYVMGRSIKIVEVGPRDGLQNEPNKLPLRDKATLINMLSESGLKSIEVGSLVSPKWVPQMADSDRLYQEILLYPDIHYPMLVPNLIGMQRAIGIGVEEIAIFTAASELFTQKNIHCSIATSLERFKPIMAMAAERGIKVRGYLSCVLGCPYQGHVQLSKVTEVAKALYQLGCYEISLGDTIGIGTPKQAKALVKTVSQEVPIRQLALHLHDTRGQALANIYACLEQGITTFDSSVAGLGGCPYANGATGNVATEDLLYMLEGMGIKTGVNLEKVIAAGDFICQRLGRQNQSKVAQVHIAKRRTKQARLATI